MTLRTLYRHHARLKRLHRSARGGDKTRIWRQLRDCTTAILKAKVRGA